MPQHRHFSRRPFGALALALSLITAVSWSQQRPPEPGRGATERFDTEVGTLLNKYCLRCHNQETMESGIRLDRLDGTLPSKRLFLWRDVLKQIKGQAMPPEDERQPSAAERRFLSEWITQAMTAARARDTQKNGSVRRLTVAQYRNTLRDLLGLEEDLTDVLPADGISPEGFVNHSRTLTLSPLLLEAYFDIAAKALAVSIVDPQSKPVIETFRMDLGLSINPEPYPDKLILGAGSVLLNNANVRVTELAPDKPFDYQPFRMQTAFDFIEGYQGNATVRGWRKFNSIYHAVFACMRGTGGYPRGAAYETVTDGLLLRPAIPSSEIFGQESTYGPRANFKVSLRELPDRGNFRVTVQAAKVDDGLLLGPDSPPRKPTAGESQIAIPKPRQSPVVEISSSGVYQADVYIGPAAAVTVPPNASQLEVGLIGIWPLDGDANRRPAQPPLLGRLVGEAQFVDSPFGKAISVDGKAASVVIPRDETIKIGEGEFTVAAWIRPHKLQQGGIVCLGGYGYTHGWVFDMPNDQGILRLETARPGKMHNGTVQSRAGVLRANQWQHVAAVVRRGENMTRLYVNGYEVGVGSIEKWDLDNPDVDLYIGRVQNAQLFAGEIDDVRLYRRALGLAELEALIEPGRRFAQAPATGKPQNLRLTLGDRSFSGILSQPSFVAVRLPAGPLRVHARYANDSPVQRVVLTRLDDLPAKDAQLTIRRFSRFEQRSPQLGVHLGLRRDCGSTLHRVGVAHAVTSTDLSEFVFAGAINNFPSPDTEEGNPNYLAGLRDIGIRSEYTDGREMPRLRIRSIEFEGPYYDSWPPASHRNLFIETTHRAESADYADQIIRSFATRAFRRPVTDSEQASLFAVWQNSYARDGDFRQSVRDVLLVVLTSPQFLFLIEHSKSPDAEDLDDYELASKLSYFLWNTAPDRQLLELASKGALHGSLDQQLTRMIVSPRFGTCVHEFTSQWLALDKFDVVQIDRSRHPRLTRDTKTELRKEPIRFVHYLIEHNLPLKNLIQSDFILANEVVAGYYGLADRCEAGLSFVPLQHELPHLGGILSQASILAGLSDGRESNPVKRGAWLARKIIAELPDDPPPNVPQLDQEQDPQLTLRQKLERHRNQKGCANCHAGIDPWGLPFEQFDAGGLLKPAAEIDARATLPDKTQVEDLTALKTYLANDRIDRVAFSFLKHLAVYAVGRSLTYNELVFLEEQGLELKADGYRMQDMIRFVVGSDLFLKK
ncbi:MAG: hypothetical protein CMJ59_20170 [Planctomycetaceae bacterium]|nr:hypothetical protein [Planctomycetaceae bacterium]